MSVVQGSTVIQRGDSNTQTDAVVNAPLLPGDYISTGDGSRAELQFDGETAIRLAGNVQARITNDDPNNRSMQLAQGTVEIGIVRGSEPFEVDTPSVGVRARDAGDYRISVDNDGATWVTARRGRVEVATNNRTYDLSPGRTLVARGAAANPSIDYRGEAGYDAFDDFNAQRDREMIAADNASPNLSPTIAGYTDLGDYGSWQDISGYGDAWVPQEPSDWAPYRDGSWVWEGGYGWTWVGVEPWGWAPYHYGRWFWANGYGWAWLPPAYAYYPTWYPALVGFYGWGGDISLDFGFPCIGWVPLAPFEPFYAWYPGWGWRGFGWGWHPWGWGGWRHWGTRIVNITNIRNIYRNFGHGGASGTRTANFEKGNFSHNVPVTSRNIGSVGEFHGALPVTPSRANLGFGRTPSRTVAFSHEFQSQRFASNPAIASRGSFADEQRSMSSAIHSSESHISAPVSHESAPASHYNAAPEARTAPSSSWSRFNSQRGNVAPSYSDRGSYARGSYARGSYGSSAERGATYTRTGDGSSYEYTRNPYASQSRSSYPSYSRGSSSYPSYSRGSSSYPSYSRGSSSYPSYSHGSSYPSYSRGSSSPSYSHPASSVPHASSSGGSHGGGHPPQ
jgi:hypothetical protein